MICQLSHLSWYSIALAFVIYFILGALWFTVFFANLYKKSLGRSNEDLPAHPIFIVGPAICSLVITLAVAILYAALGVSSWAQMLEFSALVGIGLLVANTVNIAINPNIPRPILYGIISGSYHLTGILIVNSIFLLMN
jgi:hypothetical protein